MMIITLMAILLSETPHIEFRSEPVDNFPSYWVDYFEAAEQINRDRRTTLDFLKVGREESNPLLGARPSRDKVNLLIGSIILFPHIMRDLPDWLKSSIAASIAATERLYADGNERAAMGNPDPPGRWPQEFMIVLTFRK